MKVAWESRGCFFVVLKIALAKPNDGFIHCASTNAYHMTATLNQIIIRAEKVGEPVPEITADAPEKIADFHARVIGPGMHEGKEHLHVLLLNNRLRVIGWHLVSMGGLNETSAHPREVLRPVILAGAYGFAMIHNHPSGDPSPSSADDHVTRRMVEAANIMQIRLIDHVIVGEPAPGRSRYYSFREAGLIS